MTGYDDYKTPCKVIKGKEPKFYNRKYPKGWITTSARALIQAHINLVKIVMETLPISNIIIEHNSFDFQKLENVNIKAWQYLKGAMYGYTSYKDYTYAQQNGKCLLCGCNHIDEHHHIIPRAEGGSNNPSNIAGLCNKCHAKVHNNKDILKKLLALKESKQYKIGLLCGCIDIIIKKLGEILPTTITNGKITKATRDKLSLDKDHCIDAYCISLTNNTNTGVVSNNIYRIVHFKKKAANKIHHIGSRKYYFNGKCVATNRHKAFNQKEDSLEEYLAKYRLTHTELETEQHFHQLEIKPARRQYTACKTGEPKPFKPGDKVKYIVDGSVFTSDSYRVVDKVVRQGSKGKRVKYCKLLRSRSLEYI